MVNNMDVSIIIVNYNTCALTNAVITSIIEQTKDVSFEIIVVDNHSNEPFVLQNPTGRNVRMVKLNYNAGFGGANNIGSSLANGRNILFLNPDTRLLNNAVCILSNFLDNNPQAGACGGNLYDKNLRPAHSFKNRFPSIFNEICDAICAIFTLKATDFNNGMYAKKVAYVCGACLMVKKIIFKQLGGFDKDFFMYYEDTFLAYCIRQMGYTIHSVPTAQIQHFEGQSFKLDTDREIRIFESRNLFFAKTHSKYYNRLSRHINIFLLFFAKILTQNEKKRIYSFRYSLYKKQ